jgi:AcrR family transcriptional regulator
MKLATRKAEPASATAPTPRRQRRAAEIVAAARKVFVDKGFERASVAEIAACVGVVEGLVYSYFPSKRELLNEVLRGMYEPLIQDVEAGFSRLLGLRSRLRFLIWRHLRVYAEEPGLSRLALHEVRTGPDYFSSVLHDLQVRYTSFMVRTVRDAVRDGELPAGTDADLVRSLVYGGIEHQLWAALYGRGGRIDVEALADRWTDVVLQGVQPVSRDPGRQLESRLARLEQLVAAQPRMARSARSR